MLILDAHLDLSMNALEWNRDFTRPISEIREREQRMTDKPDRGRGTVCFPEMRRGGIGICVATQIARYVKHGNPLPGWHSPEQAWAQTQGQLAWYRAMEERGEMVQIRTRGELQKHIDVWNGAPVSDPAQTHASSKHAGSETGAPLPIGYILSLEGADSILSFQHLERSYEQGLRALGPAHYGPGLYAQGTDAVGKFPPRGRELLREMDRLGMILDVTHLTDEEFWEALDLYQGPLWASHSDCRALAPHQRQFNDEQIKALAQRGAVIGAALDAWMMVPNWIRQQTTPQAVGLKLEKLIEHIDHVCQVAGNANHSGIGSDLDGGFGREQTPMDLETIADLARVPDMLRARGYREEDVRAIAHGNFLNFLTKALPQ
ncbi:MAG TPA: membrane dipeptidase [Methylomirabilota bacterium]|nr:membrane dipeptidase [Methylomirabilota bacterium]